MYCEVDSVAVSLCMVYSVLPTADRLISYTQAIGERFLRKSVFLTQIFYNLSHCGDII